MLALFTCATKEIRTWSQSQITAAEYCIDLLISEDMSSAAKVCHRAPPEKHSVILETVVLWINGYPQWHWACNPQSTTLSSFSFHQFFLEKVYCIYADHDVSDFLDRKSKSALVLKQAVLPEQLVTFNAALCSGQGKSLDNPIEALLSSRLWFLRAKVFARWRRLFSIVI